MKKIMAGSLLVAVRIIIALLLYFIVFFAFVRFRAGGIDEGHFSILLRSCLITSPLVVLTSGMVSDLTVACLVGILFGCICYVNAFMTAFM